MTQTQAKPRRPSSLEVIGRPPEGTPGYAGPPMNFGLWLSKYFPTISAWKKRIQLEFYEKLDGPFDATDLMPPGATEPAKYPAYYFMKPVHTYPQPATLHPGFASWITEWGSKTKFYFTEPETVKFWLKKVYGDLQPKRAIDIGCGTGTTTFVMAELWPDAEVIGVDLSPSMLRWARRKAEQLGVKNIFFYHMDGGDMRYFPDESFDVVNESYCLHEMPNYHAKAFIAEMVRLSKPGHLISWFDWPPAESEGDLIRRQNAVKRNSEPFMLSYLDLNFEQYLKDIGLEEVTRQVRAGANMLVTARKPARPKDDGR
jgi:ubiquinone/menaquinone biosynthesis C-methylase UbiE